ncbi:MOT42 [Auxenochlorella protothecoides x Auxenochlorella symbiontica]
MLRNLRPNGPTYNLNSILEDLGADGRIIVGRDRDCHVAASHFESAPPGTAYMLSRRHALIKAVEGRFSILDNNATNGTFLNGSPLEPESWHVLEDGDILHFGGPQTVKPKGAFIPNPWAFRFSSGGGPEADSGTGTEVPCPIAHLDSQPRREVYSFSPARSLATSRQREWVGPVFADENTRHAFNLEAEALLQEQADRSPCSNPAASVQDIPASVDASIPPNTCLIGPPLPLAGVEDDSSLPIDLVEEEGPVFGTDAAAPPRAPSEEVSASLAIPASPAAPQQQGPATFQAEAWHPATALSTATSTSPDKDACAAEPERGSSGSMLPRPASSPSRPRPKRAGEELVGGRPRASVSPEGRAAWAEARRLQLDAITEHLVCAICQENLVATHVLVPCGHLFCGACLGDLYRSFKDPPQCPTCRTPCTAPPVRQKAIDGVLDLLVQQASPRTKTMHAEKQAAWKARAAELEPVLMQALPRKVVRQTVLVARHPTRGPREPSGRLQGGILGDFHTTVAPAARSARRAVLEARNPRIGAGPPDTNVLASYGPAGMRAHCGACSALLREEELCLVLDRADQGRGGAARQWFHPACAPGHVRVLAGQQGISNLALVSRSDQEVLHRWLEGTGAGAAGGLDL